MLAVYHLKDKSRRQRKYKEKIINKIVQKNIPQMNDFQIKNGHKYLDRKHTHTPEHTK